MTKPAISIKRVAIFCGSKSGTRPEYAREAKAFATLLAKNNIELVYGGGKKGLMGIVADTVMQHGGIVRGVIPRVLTEWEHQHDNLSELMIVDDMHIRKRKMYDLCDAAMILPGGFGTLDELFEMLTWNQLSIHDKAIFILNTQGFYDHLLQHMARLSNEGFLWGELAEQVQVIATAAEFEQYLK